MEQHSNVVRLRQPDTIDDPLTEVLRAGARQLLAQAVELEVEAFLAERSSLKLPDGRARLVRHGHAPEREVQTGIGAVAVARPKVRDRGAGDGGERIRFTSAILPRWARRTRSLDALLPTLYLRGVSTGDFQEALSALLGKEAPNLSPSVIGRLTAEWQAEYGRWQERDMSARQYVYLWADGIYLQARMEEQAECMLVLIGATPEAEGADRLSGRRARERSELARVAGRPESPRFVGRAEDRGRRRRPRLLESARRGVPGTRHQRCWLHKVMNVLDKVPKSVQGKRRPTSARSRQHPPGLKLRRRSQCLSRSTERSILKRSNISQKIVTHCFPSSICQPSTGIICDHEPIESVFATVRHRTVRTKGSLSSVTTKIMVFKLVMAAAKTWRRLKGEKLLPKVVAGVTFKDGNEITDVPADRAA